jgi:hypothetical protein
MNLKRTTLEPKLPTQVVIDRQSVARRPLGASAWSRVEGREYDDLSADGESDCSANSNSDSNANANANSNSKESLERYLPEPATDGRPS